MYQVGKSSYAILIQSLASHDSSLLTLPTDNIEQLHRVYAIYTEQTVGITRKTLPFAALPVTIPHNTPAYLHMPESSLIH